MKHLYVVTGASRGLGRAIALQLRERADTAVLTLSRTPDATLDAPHVTQWAMDLAHPVEAALKLEGWLTANLAGCESASLVNNAALVTPPGPIDEVEPHALSQALRVGLEAPVLLSRAFLRATRGGPRVRRVLHISSGLGRRAMAGTAPYCAVKAGLDHFARALALDEARHGADAARVVSLAPGVVDTDMQVQLRGADPARFGDQPRFAALHEGGQLASPEAAAQAVLAYLERPDFGSDVLADVRG